MTKPNPKWDNPEESKRFLETAEAVGASEDPEDLDRALIKIARQKTPARPTKPASA